MEGWTDFFNFVSNTFRDTYYINFIIIFLWFHIFIFVGGYYLMNLFLAVVWSKFSEIENKNKVVQETHGSLAELIINKEEKERQKLLQYREKKLTEEQLIEKKREKFHFIERDQSQIPIHYRTISDLLYLDTLTPKETYNLKKQINLEGKRAEMEYQEEVNKIRFEVNDEVLQRQNTLKKQDTDMSSSGFEEVDDPDDIDKKRKLYKKKKKNFVFFEYIQESIGLTQEKWEEDVNEDRYKLTIKGFHKDGSLKRNWFNQKQPVKEEVDQLLFNNSGSYSSSDSDATNGDLSSLMNRLNISNDGENNHNILKTLNK